MDSNENQDLNNYIIPNANKFNKSQGNKINNLKKNTSDSMLEEYMKNIVSKTGCIKQKYVNTKFEDKPNEIYKLLQIIKLNELKLIIQKMDLLDNLKL